MTSEPRLREIPYNYTSFTDREIVIRYLGKETWDVINRLRATRRTGRSARMLFEVLGDMWVISRNPFVQDDLIENESRWKSLTHALHHRIRQIVDRADGNEEAILLAKRADDAVKEFENWFPAQKKLRHKALSRFSRITRKDNVDFSGLGRVSHVTDATDWRVEYPFVILYPDTEEEVAEMVRVCNELDLIIIPRGGGTGYTGSAIPLYQNTAIINTEKLIQVGPVQDVLIEGLEAPVKGITVGAGTVTKVVSDIAEKQDLIFAVDPTSWTASTIGGNISMNAGGKKAVAWGTAIDNLISWKMVYPDGSWITTERLEHNLGKIHDQEKVRFRLTRHAEYNGPTVGEPEILEFPGTIFRKEGLGKDVTDKFLGGLPGVQKEGTDGVITSAQFILYQKPVHMRTIALEFYGSDLSRAVPSIVEIKDRLDGDPIVNLMGLEHLDERYLRAVKYTPKASGMGAPKMLIMSDIGSDDEEAIIRATEDVQRIAESREGGRVFIAVSPEARANFWKDRSRTAAIAAHTNAFKINEDVVIPLERLTEYNREIERMNIELSTQNKIKMIDAVMDYLSSDTPEIKKLKDYEDWSEEGMVILDKKKEDASGYLLEVRNHWQTLMDNLDKSALDPQNNFPPETLENVHDNETVLDVMLRRDLRISYRKKVESPLKKMFEGNRLEAIRNKLDSIHARIRSGRLFVATHMHAGDGNVHTNIPVNSNDPAMMREAHHIVDRVMDLAKSLGGVISGEHGIGITKIKYMDPQVLQNLADYRAKVDPHQRFNRGKLTPEAGLHLAYTPSLSLLGQEAIILEASDLRTLNEDVKNCLRCGKCKPVCSTHVPGANLLYSPRNKILGSGLLTEAFLYEEQTRRGISLNHFEELNDVADHCTICHKCYTPCPVDIDFGEVTIHIRNILSDLGKKRKNTTSTAAMKFLTIQNPASVKMMRSFVLKPGFIAQRATHGMLKAMGLTDNGPPPSTNTKPTLAGQVNHSLKKPLPPLKGSDLRTIFDLNDVLHVPIIRNPDKITDESEAVFYFPGCGSERLTVSIGVAVLGMLYHAGVQTVIPPEYLCCGFPQKSVGNKALAEKITVDNRVLFHRVANTLNYLDIKTVIVSCGTCMDQLLLYQFSEIFPDSRLLDIHEYLMEKGIALENGDGSKYLYHDPCHTPMKTHKPLSVAGKLLGTDVQLSDRCCGEAGTLAVSRPDISTQVRFRKQEELHQGIQELTGETKAKDGNVKLLTSCPACIQGLSRYKGDTNLETKYIIEELAEKMHGKGWEKKFISEIRDGGIERVLL